MCGYCRSLTAGIELEKGPFFDGGWSCQGHGPHTQPLFWPFWRATGSAATIDSRRPETQAGSAAPPGAGERDPTSGRGPPQPSESSFTEYRKTKGSLVLNPQPLCEGLLPHRAPAALPVR